MMRDPNVPPWYLNPWGLLLAAVVLAFLGLLLSLFPGGVTTPIRVGLLVVGLAVSGGAVGWRLRQGLSEHFDMRLEPAALVAAAGGVALLAALATDAGNPQIPLARANADGYEVYNPAYDAGWDTMRALLNAMTGAALGGAALVLMSVRLRKVAVTLLVLFHFGGIITASTSAPTSSGTYPWLPSQIWNRVYRPYLCFFYLNNAYHFYSPEPGPATLLWFRVEYEDGSARWFRLAEREDSPTRLEYQRMLALTEQVNQTEPNPQMAAAMLDARRTAGLTQDIPMDPRFDVNMQYRELSPGARNYVSSYVRHVARTVKHETKPETAVKSIKVYRATHDIIRPGDLAQEADPCDPILYMIWFNGEFTPDGKLRDHTKVPGWEGLPQDPFLYWMIPVFRRPADVNDPQGEQVLVDSLRKHAGDSAIPEWETWPNQYHKKPYKAKTPPQTNNPRNTK